MARSTVVLDLEGTDGRERGEDDTSFERQSALFALANSDVVIVNLWCHDVGREHGAGKPLLRTVLQVNLRLFAAEKGKNGSDGDAGSSHARTVLCFVLRDRTKTPLDRLSPILREDLEKMWNGLTKPAALVGKTIDDVFDVRFIALPSYEMAEESFLEEVGWLRAKLASPISAGGMSPEGSENTIPAPGLSTSMREIWSVVKANKDLDLPTHRVMVATVRCAQIAEDAMETLVRSNIVSDLIDAATSTEVKNFGERCDAIVDAATVNYDEDARFFDAGVRKMRRDVLRQDVLGLLRPGFDAQMKMLVRRAIEGFETRLTESLDGGETMEDAEQKSLRGAAEILSEGRKCVASDSDWSLSDQEDQVGDATSTIVKQEREKRRAEMQKAALKTLSGVERQIRELFDSLPHNLWPLLRTLVTTFVADQSAVVTKTCSVLGLSDDERKHEVTTLEDAALDVVQNVAQMTAANAPRRLMDAFNSVFARDEQGLSRRWRATDDVVPAMKRGKRASATTLSNLCVIRLGEGSMLEDAYEKVDCVIASLLDDRSRLVGGGGDDAQGSGNDGGDTNEPSATGKLAPTLSRSEEIFSASKWPGVPQDAVLLAPCDGRRVWDKFEAESEIVIGSARDIIDAAKSGRNMMLPPPWAMAAIAVLGFNEMTWLLRSVLLNPIALIVLTVAALLLRAIWARLGIHEAMSNGFVPGLLIISGKIVPAILDLIAALYEAGKEVRHTSASPARAEKRFDRAARKIKKRN